MMNQRRRVIKVGPSRLIGITTWSQLYSPLEEADAQSRYEVQ